MTRKFGYVRGAVLPVPRKHLSRYKQMAKIVARIWKDNGAIDYVEAVSHDVKKGKVTSFPQAVKARKGELVIFSWTTFKSKAHSEQVLKKVLADNRLQKLMDPKDFPFDGARMFWGAFKTMISR